jgi:predicted MFS family arabinose efflux permease
LVWAFVLAVLPAVMALLMQQQWSAQWVLVIGLIVFGIVFALNSAIHSYLILAYSDHDRVSMNVGFYYMSNAGGRLLGTVLSGWVYQTHGLIGCLWWSCLFVLLAAFISISLPPLRSAEP